MTPETGTPPVSDARKPWRIGLVGLAVAVVAAALLGYAGGWLTPKLTHPGDTSVDAGFARDMSSHHAQAVELGMLAHEKSANPEIRLLGADIALTQQAQIGMMQTWLHEWGLSPTGSQPRMAWMPDGGGTIRDGLMPGMATEAEMAQLRAATEPEVQGGDPVATTGTMIGSAGITITQGGNLISGNGADGLHNGIRIDAGPDDTSILGNRIGTNASGNAALGNFGSGIYIRNEELKNRRSAVFFSVLRARA